MNHLKAYSIFRLSVIFLLSTFFISCKTTQNTVDSKDLSYIYNPTKNPFNPRYNVINQSDETSVLEVKFFASDLFFSEANPQGVPTSLMQLNVNFLISARAKYWQIPHLLISTL